MAVDLSVFDRIKTKEDYDRLNEEWKLKRLQAKGTAPAAIQIADEYAKARASGDVQRMNDIALAAKSFDKGIVYDQTGNPVAMQGYGDAVGSIAGTKKAYEANAQNSSDLVYDPLIAGGEAQQRQAQELGYAGPIAEAKKTAENTATQIAEMEKKATQAQSTTGLTEQARQILKGKPDETGKPTKALPTGGYLGAVGAFGNRVIGRSTETTQANADLDVIAGNLTGNVPRFEGPQSDADRQYYEKMAGRLADKTLPREDRIAAADAIDRINSKYEGIQTPTKTALGKAALSRIPMQAAQYLKQNPQYREAFDQKYGAGAAKMVLGK